MGLDFIVFRGSESNVSRFLRLHSCNGLDAKPAGALPFRMRSRRSFLGLCLVAAVSQWLGHDFIVFIGVPKATFRDFWGCSSATAWTQNLLGLCLFGCAPDAAFLGFAWWLKFLCSDWGTISLVLGVPNATFRDFWGCTPAMAWTPNLLGLCLFGCAPDAAFLGFAWWLTFRSGWGTFSLFLWGAISLFLGVPKATFRDFWGCTPAMAWTQNLLGLCLFGCAPDAAFLRFAWWLTLAVAEARFHWGCTPAMAWT